MTTIVFKNNLLYADRRGIYNPNMWDGSQHCLACGSIHYGRDNYDKILSDMFADGIALYEGNPIIAVAGSGTTMQVQALCNLLKKNFDPSIFFEMRNLANCTSGTQELAILTDKKIHLVSFSDFWWNEKGAKTYVEMEEPGSYVVAGSGSNYATMGMNTLGLNGEEAVQFASVFDQHTSSGMTVFDYRTKQKEVIAPKPREELLKRFVHNQKLVRSR